MKSATVELHQQIERPDQAVGRDAVTLFLALAIGELKLSTRDASGTVHQLTKTFMEMVSDVHNIKARIERAAADNGGDSTKVYKEVDQMCNAFFDKVQAGTVGFQFYDKLTQRLTHTTESMLQAMTLVSDESHFGDPQAWQEFRQDMRKRYNSEQDRELFEGLMAGKPIKEAIRIAEGASNKSNNVELF